MRFVSDLKQYCVHRHRDRTHWLIGDIVSCIKLVYYPDSKHIISGKQHGFRDDLNYDDFFNLSNRTHENVSNNKRVLFVFVD